MKSNYATLLAILFLIFMGIYLIFLFAGTKEVEWLGLYFLNPKDKTLHFRVDNHYNKESSCEARGVAQNKTFFKESFVLGQKQTKEIYIEPERYIRGKKNSIMVICDGTEREIYKYIK